MGWYSYDDWRPYVSVAQRRFQAADRVTKMKKAGREISPVEIARRKIAATFWGDAWCRNLESYSDYSNRLPRGRTYVRNGSVIDLQLAAGRVRALVSGSDIYEVDINIKPLAKRRWTSIKGQCAGRIDSLVELLHGSISKRVMEIVTRKGEGLFPSPREISLSCSCPDWATMCKHVAATLYGVGARLDHVPELLFTLRGVDPAEMVEAAVDRPLPGVRSQRGRLRESDELSSVFGIDIDMEEASADDVSAPTRRGRRAGRATKKSAKRSTAVKKPAGKKSAVKEKAAITKAAIEAKQAQIKQLQQELAALQQAANVLGETGAAKATRQPKKRQKRKTSAAARRAVSERMKKYWAQRKRGKT